MINAFAVLKSSLVFFLLSLSLFVAVVGAWLVYECCVMLPDYWQLVALAGAVAVIAAWSVISAVAFELDKATAKR